MCGIVGFVNGENGNFKDADRIISQMLWSDALRGFDSTGLVVATGDKYNYYKRALPSPDYLRTLPFEKMMKPRIEAARVCIGHNRAATRGTVCDENAHPFMSDDRKIILVHNGCIDNANSLLPQGIWVTVDSAAVPLVMEDKGEKEALEALRGAYSLAWYNTETKRFNLARNDKREMFYGYIKGKNILIYGSEWLMLHWILARNRLEVDKWIELPPGQWLSFKGDNPKEVNETVFQLPPNIQQSAIRGVHITGNTAGTGGTNAGYGAIRPGDNLQPHHRVDLFLDLIKNLDPPVRLRSGIPKQRPKLEKLASRLSLAGYHLGESIGVRLTEFSSYKNQKGNLGVAFGHRVVQDAVKVRIHGISKAEFEIARSKTYFYVNVIGFDLHGKRLELIGMPSPLSLRPDQAGHWSQYGVGLGNDDPDDEIPFGEIDEGDFEDQDLVKISTGEVLTVEEFLKVMQDKCSWCSGNLMQEDKDEFTWIDKKTVLCPDCAKDPATLTMLGLPEKAALGG